MIAEVTTQVEPALTIAQAILEGSGKIGFAITAAAIIRAVFNK